MKAMILAAGRGERLRPITDSIPKPLVKIVDKPLIQYHIEKLKKANIDDIVINTAWLPEKLVEFVGNGKIFGVNIQWSHEKEGGLETAGGIRNALNLLGKAPFLVVNGDTFIDEDYSNFAKYKLSNEYAHVWLTENPKHNQQGDFDIRDGLVVNEKRYTFTGIAIYNPIVIEKYDIGRIPLKQWFVEWISKGKMTGELLKSPWFDIGTVERLEIVCDYVKKKNYSGI